MDKWQPCSQPYEWHFRNKVWAANDNFGLNIFISENNIHGNYNIVIYINIIGLERKKYSLFGSSPEETK